MMVNDSVSVVPDGGVPPVEQKVDLDQKLKPPDEKFLTEVELNQFLNTLTEDMRNIARKASGAKEQLLVMSHAVRRAKVNVEDINFGIGDYVLVARREPKKIEPRWFGPARIVREVNPRIYEIELLDGSESTITAHASRMKFYGESSSKVTADVIQRAKFYH